MPAIHYGRPKLAIAPGKTCDDCTQPAQVRVTLPMFDATHLCGADFDSRKADLEKVALAVEDARIPPKQQRCPESVIAL